MTGECQHCGASVSKSYVRVMSADGVDAVHGCPSCEARPAGRQEQPERLGGKEGGQHSHGGEDVGRALHQRREETADQRGLPNADADRERLSAYTDGGRR